MHQIAVKHISGHSPGYFFRDLGRTAQNQTAELFHPLSGLPVKTGQIFIHGPEGCRGGRALHKRDMNRISRLFADFGTNIPADADDMTGGSHFDQLAVVGLSVKGGMNRNAAFAKGFLHIEGNFHIGAV